MSGAKIISFLERLEDLIPDRPIEDVPGIVEALITVGDELDLSYENPSGNWMSMSVMIDRSVIRLMGRLDEARREQVLVEAIGKSRNASTPVHVVQHYLAEHGEHRDQPLPESERTFTAETTEKLKSTVLKRIEKSAGDGTLLDAPHLAYVLYRWLDWASLEAPRTWVEATIVESDDNLGKILTAMSRNLYTYSGSTGQTTIRLNPEWLRPFLDPEAVVERARKLAESNPSAAQFVREYEMVQRGEDPDDLRHEWR